MNERIRFPREEKKEFFTVLRGRISAYFRENQIDRYGNRRIHIKTAVLMAAYVLFYALIIGRVSDAFWINQVLWLCFGTSIAGIGLSVMHDASHGAYSKNKRMNSLMANSMTFIGGSAYTWKIQHIQLHHSYTNIEGKDEDIDPGVFMRFSPHKKRYWLHRFQHIYAWFFYGLMTLTWSLDKDFKQLHRYQKDKTLKKSKNSLSWILTKIIFSKLVFHFLTIGLPLLLLPDPWYLTLFYVFSMHFIAGLILACVFQPAHVVPSTDYPLPNEEGSMENNWAIHQLHTTSNYAPNSKVLSWFVGGLNYQIEHHLFPNVCHVHHKALSKIVEKTTREFNLPYHVQGNFVQALWEHAKMLKLLGRTDSLQGDIA